MVLKDFALEIGLRVHGYKPASRIPVKWWCSYQLPVDTVHSHIPGIRQVGLHPCIRRPISNAKSFRIMEILVDLCFLDIVVTLPSLPTHYSRRKVHLKTRGFSTFWEFSLCSIGNPIVMKIDRWIFNRKSMVFQQNLVKHLAMFLLGSDTVTAVLGGSLARRVAMYEIYRFSYKP